jgi:hypothetical protein
MNMAEETKRGKICARTQNQKETDNKNYGI